MKFETFCQIADSFHKFSFPIVKFEKMKFFENFQLFFFSFTAICFKIDSGPQGPATVTVMEVGGVVLIPIWI